VVVQKAGTAHQNLNRVRERLRAPYTCILDEDVEILQDGWIERLIADLEANPAVGLVGCAEIKEESAKISIPRLLPDVGPLRRLSWIPAYCMVFPRTILEKVTFDESIPGDCGMTDVDACLQVDALGYEIAKDPEVVVYHPPRDDDETRSKEQRPTLAQQRAWFPGQVDYMIRKWGHRYTRAVGP
jgi:GT2 family glycosyltransferase